MRDQRKFMRHTLNSTVSVFNNHNHEYLGIVVDISEQGLMVSSAMPLECDKKYILQIVDAPVNGGGRHSGSISARAVWSAKINSTMYGTGFEIESRSEQASAMFKRYVEEGISSRS
ncbi:MAG: PilZ domain-containing protein [Oceanospirillaceae bacterium]|nr:PilZ domain-containing protein [Oceanospirillaceae bacterium]